MALQKLKNKAAQALGKLGGQATAKRGSEYYKEISKKGVRMRQYHAALRHVHQMNKYGFGAPDPEDLTIDEWIEWHKKNIV